jgi:hypothetical protein
MNAFFRRDYLYQFKSGAFKDVTLRYLNYDRTTKEYVFLEGEIKTKGELAIRVKRAHYIEGRIERVQCIGYKNTNQYKRTDDKRLKTKKVEKLLGFKDLKLGKTYEFTKLKSAPLSCSQPMELTRFDGTGNAIFGIKNQPEYQILVEKWLDNGLVSVKEVI